MAARRRIGGRLLHESEIDELHLRKPVLVENEHEVRRLDIEVDDSVAVRIVESLGGLGENVESVRDAQRAGFGNKLPEVTVGTEFDRVVKLALDLAAVRDAGDAGMCQARLLAGLFEKSRA